MRSTPLANLYKFFSFYFYYSYFGWWGMREWRAKSGTCESGMQYAIGDCRPQKTSCCQNLILYWLWPTLQKTNNNEIFQELSVIVKGFGASEMLITNNLVDRNAIFMHRTANIIFQTCIFRLKSNTHESIMHHFANFHESKSKQSS